MKRTLRSAVAAMLVIVTLGLWTSASAAAPPDHQRLELVDGEPGPFPELCTILGDDS